MADRYGNRDDKQASRPLRQSDIARRGDRSGNSRNARRAGRVVPPVPGDLTGWDENAASCQSFRRQESSFGRSGGARASSSGKSNRRIPASRHSSCQTTGKSSTRPASRRVSSAEDAYPSGRSSALGRTPSSRRRASDAQMPSASVSAASSRHPGISGRAAQQRPVSRASANVAQPKRKSGGKLKIVLMVVAALLLVGVGAAFAYYENINGNLHSGLDQDIDKYLVETDLTNEPFYMLLMGTDGSSEREADESFGGSFRTDSIILARIDPVNKKVSMVSIHRDSEVDMGEYGQQKINAAHAFGGASLSVQTVSKMAGVDISHYAEINFDGFRDIVDALGGVEVDVPVEIDDEDAGGHLDAGLQTLDGDQALILCRSRNTYANAADPDSMRAANQRLVLSAIAQKILSSDVATIANSVTAISKYVTTDLDAPDIIGLAQAMRGMDASTDMYTAMEPVTSEYVDGGWYTYTNKDEWAAMMKRMDEGLPPSETAEVDEQTGTVIATNGTDADASDKYASVVVKNGTTKSSRTITAVDLLKDAGFVNASGADANSSDYAHTLVIYDSSSQEYEAKQIVAALGQGSAQLNDGSWLHDGTFLVIIGSDWED